MVRRTAARRGSDESVGDAVGRRHGGIGSGRRAEAGNLRGGGRRDGDDYSRNTIRRVGDGDSGGTRIGGLTISRLAHSFGLARSTLLHYDRIGVLKPDSQSAAGYRLYGPAAQARLARIVELRSAGLSLQTIKRVLETRTALAEALEKQVTLLNQQVAQLRAQQRVVLSMLASPGAVARSRSLSKEAWTKMFRAIGMSDEDMRAWHTSFEASMPEAHQDFLESLGLDAADVRRIRAWAAAVK